VYADLRSGVPPQDFQEEDFTWLASSSFCFLAAKVLPVDSSVVFFCSLSISRGLFAGRIAY